MAEVLLVGARVPGHDGLHDVRVDRGVVTSVAPSADPPDPEAMDLAGRVVVPGLVNSHCHLDKTLFGRPWVSRAPVGPGVAGLIAEERSRRREVGVPDVEAITALLHRMAAGGTRHVRSHTDLDPDVGLDGVHAVAEAAARCGLVEVTQVAFPQSGLVRERGVQALMELAAAEGLVQVVGGLDPAGVDDDPLAQLDVVFALADRHGLAVDVHLHDRGGLGRWQVGLVCERTRALGLGGRVALSHAFAVAEARGAVLDDLLERLASAGVALHTCAGGDDPVPSPTRLRAAGVTLGLGTDGVADLWTPFGTGDLLAQAHQLARRSVARTDDELAEVLTTATYGGARALGLTGYGLAQGAPADLVVLDATSPAEAVAHGRAPHLVVNRGDVLAPA